MPPVPPARRQVWYARDLGTGLQVRLMLTAPKGQEQAKVDVEIYEWALGGGTWRPFFESAASDQARALQLQTRALLGLLHGDA